MNMNERIRVTIDVPGVAQEAHEYEHCPIHIRMDGDNCPLDTGITNCPFGLTTIEVPKACPLRIADVCMKFTRIKADAPMEDQ